MNQMTAIALQPTLGDWPGPGLVSIDELERANEMIRLLDTITACMQHADDLMLHICSAGVGGRTLNLASSLREEVSGLVAQAQYFARHF